MDALYGKQVQARKAAWPVLPLDAVDTARFQPRYSYAFN